MDDGPVTKLNYIKRKSNRFFCFSGGDGTERRGNVLLVFVQRVEAELDGPRFQSGSWFEREILDLCQYIESFICTVRFLVNERTISIARS